MKMVLFFYRMQFFRVEYFVFEDNWKISLQILDDFFILENWTFHFLEGIEKFMVKTTLNIFFYQVQNLYDNWISALLEKNRKIF